MVAVVERAVKEDVAKALVRVMLRQPDCSTLYGAKVVA